MVESAPSAATGLRSLLVPVDLTPTSDRVLGRVARLPLAERARVTLLHVVPGDLSAREQRAAERDAAKTLADEARHLASSLPGSIVLRTVVGLGNAAREITELAGTEACELVVMGRGGARVVRDTILGSTAERVMRLTRVPVLAVRLAARAPYRKPALAIELDAAAAGVFAWLLRLLPPPRPRIEVIHAFSSPLESRIYPSLSEDEIEERRAELKDAAARRLDELLTRALADLRIAGHEAPWRPHLRHGPARQVVHKAVKSAHSDLLVMGTRAYSGLAQLFLGSVAGDLLRDVSCDVLLVPPAAAEPAPDA